MKSNNKVPVAILSCFLIFFVLQGILKLCGVFVFEKVLDWEIFDLIDKYKWLQVIFYSFWSIAAVYCLSFSLTSKPYSKKWYHYVIIVASSVAIMALREFVSMPIQINIALDALLYIIIPFIINITTEQPDRIFKNNCFGIVTTLALNIMMYFCYLGLGYWSTMLDSLIPVGSMWLTSSRNFIIHFERYIGLAAFMLSTNELIKYIRRNNNMLMPVDIASKKAKLEAKQKKLSAKVTKLNGQLADVNLKLKELEEKEAAK